MTAKQIQTLMTGLVVLTCVIGGITLICNGIDGRVGVVLLIIVAGYLGIDLSPWMPIGRNQKKKDNSCCDKEDKI